MNFLIKILCISVINSNIYNIYIVLENKWMFRLFYSGISAFRQYIYKYICTSSFLISLISGKNAGVKIGMYIIKNDNYVQEFNNQL